MVGLGSAACATTPLSTVPGGMERARLYPSVVTVGDVLEVAYYLDARLQEEVYRVGVGDTLQVEVADHPDLSQDTIRVLPDGRISLKLAGAIQVAGETVDALGTQIAELYRQHQIRDPQVVVSVKEGQYRLKQFMSALMSAQGSNRLELKVYDEQPLVLPFIAPVATGRPLSEVRQEIVDAYTGEFGQ